MIKLDDKSTGYDSMKSVLELTWELTVHFLGSDTATPRWKGENMVYLRFDTLRRLIEAASQLDAISLGYRRKWRKQQDDQA